jgi:hypothetical protein
MIHAYNEWERYKIWTDFRNRLEINLQETHTILQPSPRLALGHLPYLALQ